MKQFWLLLQMLGVSLLSLVLATAMVWLSFWGAQRNNGGKDTRLRWYMIASSPIHRGHRLSEENVSWQLGRIADDLRFLPKSSMAVGKYASVEIPAGTCLNSDNLTQFAAAAAPENGDPVTHAEDLINLRRDHENGAAGVYEFAHESVDFVFRAFVDPSGGLVQ